jgi:hypothetical protein
VVVHAQGERGGVDHAQALRERVLVGDVLEHDRVGVRAGVVGVDALDPVLADEDLVAVGLQGTLRGHRVRGEVGHPGAGAEDDDPALVQVAHGAQRDVGLGDLSHRDGGLHARAYPGLLKEVLQRQRVHHRAEHAHVVRARAVQPAGRELRAAEEVATADDDGDLDALALGLRDLAGDAQDDVRVEADVSPAEDLTGELEHDAAGAWVPLP